MLTLVYGTDWTANREYILKLLADDVSARRPGRILIVPELISHDTERMLCAAAGDTCSRYAEVLSFSRLTRRVCDWAGCGLEECLDEGGRFVAMAAAARQLHSKLKAYASLETKPEFLTGLLDAIDEFKRCCISSADLLAASKSTEGAFAQKLEELSLILEAYEAVCQQGKRDPRDQLAWGLEIMQECDFAESHVFYIDGFPDFTMQNMAVITYLIVHAPNVVISINCDRPGSENLSFEKAGDTAGKLLRIAQQNEVAVNLVEITPKLSQLAGVRGKLFQGKVSHMPEIEGKLITVEAESVSDECVIAAERVFELVNSGARFRDISVVCPDVNTYGNALNLHFQMCGIPLYLAGTDEILEKSVISTVLTALDAVIGGFETKDILRYLKSALSPLSLDDCDELENYVLLWGVQGRKWITKWTMHPGGLQDIWSQTDYETLDRINAIRDTAISPLVKLSSSFKSATKLEDQIDGLYEFLEQIQLQERLAYLAENLNASGDNRTAQILSQLWEILLSALEQLRGVLGQTSWDNESFIRLFKLLLSQYDVGTIPPVLDTVMVGPVSAMRCQQVRHLIVIGACEGSFPSYGTSVGVLSDQERDALRQMGIPLTGGASEGLKIEFSEIYGVFCGVNETVYMTCLAGQSSFVFRRLSQMAGGIQHPSNALGAAAVNSSEAASLLLRYRKEETAQQLGIHDLYQRTAEKRDHTVGAVSKDGIRAIYGQKLNLSASQADMLADCRLAYFLKYGLRLKEQKPVSVDPAEFGTYVHAVLEETAREIVQLGGFKAVSLDQTLAIAKRHADAYAANRFHQIDSQRLNYLFQRNNHELMMVVEELWNELQNSSFVPIDFEVAFGDNTDMPAIQIPTNSIHAQLRGFVDRVDVWQEDGRNYFRVVDYKTGKKDFDYCDVFNGLGLQMLLYLFALEQEGEHLLGQHPIPAGVQYFPARVPVITSTGNLSDEEAAKERLSTLKRKGLILSDDDVLFAMENSDSPTRLSCKRKKDGTVSGDVASREQFRLLSKYVFCVLGKMVDDIASGNVDPNPYTRGSSHNACRFCPYGTVCHAATVEGRRNYKIMSAQRFWDDVEREVNKHE